MAWNFAIAVVIALCLIQFGALSVWVTVLSVSLKAVLGIAFVVVLYFGLKYLWRQRSR